MRTVKLLNLIVAGCVFLALAGSANAVLADPDALVEDGKFELFFNQDLLDANDDFSQALIEDSTHARANFWYGLTRFGVVIQSAEMVTLLNNFGFTKSDGVSPLDQAALNPFNPDIKPPTDTFGDIDLPVNSPDFEAVQNFFKNTFLAQIDAALTDNFGIINENTYADSVDLGDGPIEIDGGEVLACRALFNLFSCLFHTFCVYDTDALDIDDLVDEINDGTANLINTFLGMYTDLFTPLPDAATQIATAETAASAALNGFLDTISFIQGETDPQHNDLLALDDSDPELAADIEDAEDALNSFLSALSGPTLITVPREDVGRIDIHVTLDLSEFFDDADVINFRSLLPAFTTEDYIVRSSFPDPTLGGMLPDSTPADWNHYLYLGPELSRPKVYWSGDMPYVQLWWWKQEDNPDFSYYRIYRTTTPENLSSWTQISGNITDPEANTFTDHDVSESVSRKYYYRLYTYYTSESDATYDEEKAVLTVYVDVNSASADEDGSRQYPFTDLNETLRKYVTHGTKVHVAAGTYEGFWLFKRDGLILKGGYESNGWTRDIESNPTVIIGSLDFYWMFDTIIDGFTITNSAGFCGLSLNSSNSVTIQNCTITNGSNHGIGIFGGATATVTDCVISGNGNVGVYCSSNTSVTIKNNLIYNNSGDGINVGWTGDRYIENNTITGNGGNGGIRCHNSSPSIKDNIIYNNNNGGAHYGIYCSGTSAPTISYNAVYGNTAGDYFNCSAGPGDISQDPLFAAGPYGDYYLSQIIGGQAADSPGVDSGSASAGSLGFDYNYTTSARGQLDTGTVDMGYHYPVDLDGTYNPFIAADLDGNFQDEVVVDFGPAYGIWIRYNNSTWGRLHTLSAGSMAAGRLDSGSQDDLIIDFGDYAGIWIWYNDTTWDQLHDLSAERMVTADIKNNGYSEITIDFGTPYGIWTWYPQTAIWSQLHKLSCYSMTAGRVDGNNQRDLIIDFGTPYGIWIRYNDTTWGKLHDLSSKSIVTADINDDNREEVIIDFGELYGTWAWYPLTGSWSRLTTYSPDSITAGDLDLNSPDDLVIDFGSPYGIWNRYNDLTWDDLHYLSPEWIITGDMDGNWQDEVIIDFGDPHGLWIYYNDSSWIKLHDLSP